MDSWAGPNQEKKRRRSQRVMLALPITVSGEGPNGSFSEDARTVVVNAHGALINLATKVAQQQLLELKSPANAEKQACRVTFVGPTTDGRTQLGIEFIQPAPQFWHIAFPPEDWTPLVDMVPVAPATKPKA
jgi:hypothetical protein